MLLTPCIKKDTKSEKNKSKVEQYTSIKLEKMKKRGRSEKREIQRTKEI